MRRFALALLVSLSAAALVACNTGYGGTAFGSGNNDPTQISFTNGTTNSTFFKVAPGAQSALQITAIGTKGGPDIVQPGASYTWTVRYGNAGDTYQLVNTTTGITTNPACPAVSPTANPPLGALFLQGTASGTSSGSPPPYTINTVASTIGVLPSGLATPAATAPTGSGTATAPVYCLVLTATANNGVSGRVTVLVSN